MGAVSLTLDASTRTLKAEASIGPGRQVTDCLLDLFKDANATSGQTIRTGSQLSWVITPDRNESYSLQARFRCQDDQGRLAVSPWTSLVTVPALVIPPVVWEEVALSYATATETATLTARIGAGRLVSSCKAELLEAGKISSQTVTALTQAWKIADSSSHTVQGRFVCVDDLGRETVAPWSSSVTIPPAPLVQWSSVSLVGNTQTRSVNLSAQIGSGRSLVNCVADLSLSTTATPFISSGVSALSFQYAVTQTTAMNVVGRFRCDDDRGRATVSPWSSAVALPAATMGPALNTVSDRILPSQYLLAGSMLSLNFDNITTNPASDAGMSYQCAFKRLASSDSSLITCSQLSGAFSFDGSNGQLNWSPDSLAVGAYQFEITGSNSFGSAVSSFKVNVMPGIDYANRLFHLDARFADGLRGGQNSSNASTVWKNLINQTPLTMTGFVPTSTWIGSNAGPDLTALSFPGSTASASFAAPYPAAQAEIHIDALIYEGNNANEKVILSSGSAAGHGFTLTNRRFFVGLSSYGSIGNYTAEVTADAPQLYWRFNDLSGNIVADFSGNGRSGNAANSGSITLTTDALSDAGSQAALNTGNGYYQLQTAYDPGSNWTIETWFKYPLDDNCSDDWCSLVRGSNTNFHWVIVQKGTMDIGVHYNGFYTSGYSLSKLNAGWHHLAAVGTGGNTQFYIDGGLVGTVVGMQAYGQIGSVAGEGSFSFGEIDEFAIYNQALSVARIQAHAQAGGAPIQCSLNLNANSWNHIVGTVSDTTQTLKLHLNGNDMCTVTKPVGLAFAGSTEPIRIGASVESGSTGWNGAVASLILYNNTSTANAASNNSALNPGGALPVGGLVSWFRADRGLYQDAAKTTAAITGNDPVHTWADYGYGKYDLTVSGNTDQLTARPRLNVNGPAGKPVLNFDGSDDNLANYFNYDMPSTIFYVGRYTGAGPMGRILSSPGRNWLLGTWNNGMDCAHFDTWINSCGSPDYNWRIYASAQTANDHKFYSYTQLLGSSTATVNGPLGLSLGGWINSENSASEIAELIVYNRVLTDSERTQVMMYLNQRYGIYGN